MKIGIIVHSQTGNTFYVGQKILEKLQNAGYEVSLLRIQNIGDSGEKSKTQPLQLDFMPEIVGFDAVILGAWVEAFNLCQGFKLYLQKLDKIEVPRIFCFVTQYFPCKWMGGSRALTQVKKILSNKEIKAKSIGVINWSNKKREQQIDDLVSKIMEEVTRGI